MSTKYDPLRAHLRASGASSITLSFSEIEALLDESLPPTAERRPEWWANETNPASRHVQCHAWRDAGYNAFPNLGARTVMFRRIGSN
jgi:hypothetical protein